MGTSEMPVYSVRMATRWPAAMAGAAAAGPAAAARAWRPLADRTYLPPQLLFGTAAAGGDGDSLASNAGKGVMNHAAQFTSPPRELELKPRVNVALDVPVDKKGNAKPKITGNLLVNTRVVHETPFDDEVRR
ncbi:MAG: hypothetical protein VX017_10750, partial [Pseudomonadota bacterium]|nr:hypothetical protein [Pseudomonadota bacterium]